MIGCKLLVAFAAIFIAWLLVRLAETEAENEVLRAYLNIRRDASSEEKER